MVDAFPTILLLRFVHITVASVAVGATLAFRFWLRLARREPEHLAFVIRGIRWIDRWVAEPAYFLAFATGVAMVLWGVSSFTAGWPRLRLYAAIAVLGITVFGPVVWKQLAALSRRRRRRRVPPPRAPVGPARRAHDRRAPRDPRAHGAEALLSGGRDYPRLTVMVWLPNGLTHVLAGSFA